MPEQSKTPTRTMWKGNIHFRSVDVPVNLHPAVHENKIEFHLLHRKDHARLKQQMVCAHENVPVPPDEQTKGFELEERKYLLVDAEEFEQIEPENSRLIDVHGFVKNDQIDPIFIERLYYLEPDSQAQTYQALVEALSELDLAAICTWTMRKRSYVGALQVRKRALRLAILRYGDEVISPKSLELKLTPLAEKELKIGTELINKWSGPFRPQKFENEHLKKLQQLIDKKARGEKIAVLRPHRMKPTPSSDLLKTLEASLKQAA